MNTELEAKKMLAIEFGLLPKGIDEFEFAIVVTVVYVCKGYQLNN